MNDAILTLEKILPFSVFSEIAQDTEEIRMKIGAPFLYKTGGERIFSHLLCTKELFDSILEKICNKSFYSHIETIKEGYIPMENGIRVGLSGRAVTENGKILQIKELDFLCIRIPHEHKGIASPLVAKMKESSFLKGALLFSKPGVGKTTVLREFTRVVSSYYNTALIDTRGELSPTLPPSPTLNVYLYYPKKEALSMALRTASPDLVVLDEIGSEEAAELSASSLFGVPILASAHSSTLEELLSREDLRPLLEKSVFPLLCKLTRNKDKMDFQFYSWKEIQKEKAAL